MSLEWTSFLTEHEKDLCDSPFEREFVVRVLANVNGLRPDQVQPQQAFVDSAGRTRRIDFAVVRGDLRLAIEVDGVEKVRGEPGLAGDRLDDAWQRQNDLGARGWDVLRFTNTQIMSESAHCARVISERLARGNRLLGTSSSSGSMSPVASSPAAPGQPIRRGRSRGWMLFGVLAVGAVVAIIASANSQQESPGLPTPTQGPPSVAASEEEQLRADVAAGALAPIAPYVCPETHPIKANYNVRAETRYYFLRKDGRFYLQTTPTSCWATAGEAEVGGYSRPPAAKA